MKKLLAFITATFMAFNSQAANLQPLAMNDPVFNELTDSSPDETSNNSAEQSAIEGLQGEALENLDEQNAEAIEQNPEQTSEQAVLAEEPRMIEIPINNQMAEATTAPNPTTPEIKRHLNDKFMLADSDLALNGKISDELGEDNVTVSNLNFKRIGSNKIFGFERVKKIVLPTSFTINNIDINKETNSFKTTVKPQLGAYEIEITGSFSANVKIPVMARTVNKGTEITQEDIELKNFPKNKLHEDYIVNVADIIGKAAGKTMLKGTPFSKNQIKVATTIKKNSTVSAIYKNNAIEVKTLAVAQEDGAVGDVIKLKNFDSGKGFKAVVQADGTVSIELNNSSISLTETNNNGVL